MGQLTFKDFERGVTTSDLNGNVNPVGKGDVLVFSNGAIGKVLGVTKSFDAHGMAMVWYPHGDDGKSAACSYPASLKHTVKLPNARITNANFDSHRHGIKMGEHVAGFNGRYFKKLPINAYNESLVQAVKAYF
ncbi:hypothetical protein G6Z92_06170 [Vibrio aestuarianus subsp. cardii]|uniref:hypothetical protein n=1 Tax=Vibrio aestuarianus TaxID=28171 RepID=UPI0015C54000|nr:hypothetical protein [Vibrio aestuarianus]NGZ66570.1 hypothetical protein [Vibrio aestuarianus subsp. cardii]